MDTAVGWGSGAASSQSCLGVVALFGFCGGTAGKEDGFWQPPAAVGPSGAPCVLQHGNRDGGTPEGAPVRCPSIQEIVLRGALEPAVLPFGLRSSAVAAGEDPSSKDVPGTRLSISTE